MTDTPNTPPAGYYDDGSGRQRWWDGVQWTDHFQDTPVAPAAAPPAPPTATTYATESGAGVTSVATGNPRADAKAAKAYAKASRPWFKKKRWWAAIVVIAIIIAAAAGSGGGSGSDDKNTSTSPSDTKKDSTKKDSSNNSGKKSSAKPNAFGSSKLPLQNGDWRLDSIVVKNDGLGDFGGTARITYTGDDKDGGSNVFTITAFSGKDLVATLQGSANTVRPGTTVTVQLISQDKFRSGTFKYDFQNDL
ncbi:MAG: hypothetical protein JWQ70_186 [Aeromicrobium sp.]|nr:hypothetical protein [Aeromicrobium sp.]